ncbi:hypothetical protein CLV30_12271 [Haloactinopolyspora alba]|uniref:Uncharacterized protein n=1 Tax=Haloactinopolyspora alba TaxID=648780 RepID=A0A2P8DK52_9ACTN|nr:hypothetical protein [Haloactinopolyspora alba]PSK97579.1 hypothetical protein CLV30_12271 [Haloactinopolyspora alba]
MTDARTVQAHAGPAPRGRLFWTLLVVGATVTGYGVYVAWSDRADTNPADAIIWLTGAGIVHDLVVAPLIVLLTWASGRLPDAARLPIRLGLAFSALITVLFWPVVQGWGRSASVPSALPLDYGRNLVVVLAVVWAAVGAAVVVRTRKEMR